MERKERNLQVAAHLQLCKIFVGGDQNWACPYERKERKRQAAPSGLEGSRQPHSLS
jgi:hypothetical protein